MLVHQAQNPKSGLLVAGMLALACACPAPAQNYSVVELGSLGGPSYAYALDSAGRAGGASLVPLYNFHPTLWQGGVVDLTPPVGYLQGFTFAFDASGRPLATVYNLGAIATAGFAYDAGGPVSLGALAPRGANGAGDIVGTTTVTLPTGWVGDHAALWRAGVVSDLGTLGGSYSRAIAIGPDGRIVGSSDIAGDGATHACLWRNGVVRDLGTLGGQRSEAHAVNTSGMVVGYSDQTSGPPRACLFQLDGADNVVARTNLGALSPAAESFAYGVNEAGDVVGESGGRAFIRPAGSAAMVDLNTRISPASGWSLAVAMAINDSGRIVGWGDRDGRPAAFELVLCPADLTGDGVVGSADLAQLLGAWGSSGSTADLTGDGVVNAADLAQLLGSWGACG